MWRLISSSSNLVHILSRWICFEAMSAWWGQKVADWVWWDAEYPSNLADLIYFLFEMAELTPSNGCLSWTHATCWHDEGADVDSRQCTRFGHKMLTGYGIFSWMEGPGQLGFGIWHRFTGETPVKLFHRCTGEISVHRCTNFCQIFSISTKNVVILVSK